MWQAEKFQYAQSGTHPQLWYPPNGIHTPEAIKAIFHHHKNPSLKEVYPLLASVIGRAVTAL